jgi:hypothetical protein
LDDEKAAELKRIFEAQVRRESQGTGLGSANARDPSDR